MGNFVGQLNQNEIFNAIYNMIISQEVFSDNIDGVYGGLAAKARVDGTLYGDTKLYYSTDALETHEWLNDLEASNLLALDRPKGPEVQAITLNNFRQIRLTVDEYLSKRAFSTEGAFATFNSVMLGWIRDTKRIFDARLYNVFFGTDETNVGKQLQTITLPKHSANEDATETEAINRLRGETIAEFIANLIVDMKDATRDYNDYGHIRSYAENSIMVVWNSAYVNQIKKLDLPALFHKEGLVNKLDSDVLPSKYFGEVTSVADTAEGGALAGGQYVKANGIVVRAKVEKKVGNVHYFAGDELEDGTTVGEKASFTYDECYKVNPNIVCKVVIKLAPFMSAFEVGTTFFNPCSLTENHYLTWGYNTLEHLKNYPLITIKENVPVVANTKKLAK